jgi:Tfp pilus assembly protein PilF
LQNTSHEAIEKEYQEIFSLQPDYAPALFSYALFCKNHDRQKQAIEYYDKTLAVAPNDATVLCSYGVLLSEEAFTK